MKLFYLLVSALLTLFVLMTLSEQIALANELCAQLLIKAEPKNLLRTDLLNGLSFEVTQKTAADLNAILDASLVNNLDAPITGAQFNKIFAGLQKYANSFEIELQSKSGLLPGVYPVDLKQLNLVKLRPTKNLRAPVSAALRHELGHLFHTIYLRIIIIESLRQREGVLQAQTLEQANRLLEELETGANYLEFEKAVTALASPLGSWGGSANSSREYKKRIGLLLSGTAKIIFYGKVKFASGKTFEEIYALILSKSPLLFGDSELSLLRRLPFLLFASLYLINPLADAYLDTRIVCPNADLDGEVGFRDCINELLQRLQQKSLQ